MSDPEDRRTKPGLPNETTILLPDFGVTHRKRKWQIKELQELKDTAEGKGKYDRSDAVFTIVAGAGGDDAEDFRACWSGMYQRYAEGKGWGMVVIDSNANDRNSYRNNHLVQGRGRMGLARSGVHQRYVSRRLNANGKRQTSFVLVEVSPRAWKIRQRVRSSKMGTWIFRCALGGLGQNVNKA